MYTVINMNNRETESLIHVGQLEGENRFIQLRIGNDQLVQANMTTRQLLTLRAELNKQILIDMGKHIGRDSKFAKDQKVKP